MEKHFIEPKRSELRSVFLIFLNIFLAMTQIALFLAKTAPCPFPYESLVQIRLRYHQQKIASCD
jgi:hypothetical protein